MGSSARPKQLHTAIAWTAVLLSNSRPDPPLWPSKTGGGGGYAAVRQIVKGSSWLIFAVRFHDVDVDGEVLPCHPQAIPLGCLSWMSSETRCMLWPHRISHRVSTRAHTRKYSNHIVGLLNVGWPGAPACPSQSATGLNSARDARPNLEGTWQACGKPAVVGDIDGSIAGNVMRVGPVLLCARGESVCRTWEGASKGVSKCGR